MQNVEPSPLRPVPSIRGERVYLRPAERADIELFVRWLSDAEVTRHLAIRAPFSRAMEEKWFDEMLARQGKEAYHFVICLLDGDRAIGTTGFHHVNYEDGHASFGISIGEKSEWSKGYGTDALRAICDFGFGQLRLERIGLMVYADNARGRRAYEKAGFVHEGTLRHAHYARGTHHDVHVMSLLRAEWDALPHARSWDR
jgi:RimJ/RimL family protein N-acetyltransferase